MSEADLEGYVLDELAGVGWRTARGPTVAPGEPGAERGDYREVVLVGRLRAAVHRLNPDLDAAAVEDVVRAALRAESQVPVTESWRAYRLLTQGVPVERRGPDGQVRYARAALVDWAHPERNDLLAVDQFTVLGADERRADVVLFVNGLPLVLVELKRPGEQRATLRGAFHQVQTYRARIPDLFTWVQVAVVSDGVQARAASWTAPWEHYQAWRTVDGRREAPGHRPQVETLVRGMLRPGVLLDLVRHFTTFTGTGPDARRVVAKYHQYWAVTKAVDATVEAVEGDGRAGVVWHTQGSGKSLEMLWYAGRVMAHPAMGNPTVVVVTDRNDLDDQLFDDTFAAARPGAPLPEAPVQAESRAHLQALLEGRQSGGIVFTTIQKFGLTAAERAAGASFPTLTRRVNVVVMVDEAHRSNYDFVDGFARHLRDGLPDATFIGFTGTPVEAADRSTREVFGDYLDVYDLTQAVEDGATVKVLYEPRLARVELPAAALGDLDAAFAEATSGSEEQAAERLKTRWARVEAVVGSDTRIAELAADVVAHWEARREVLAGKGMVVTMSRRIAAALYEQIRVLRPGWCTDDDATGRVKVVVTGSAADAPELQPHIRSKEALRAVKARAKDPDDPLELVVVRDMWLTGFDSPALHTLYVDKPMRGAALMQAVARVNRRHRDKPAGLVVDYLGIAEDLKAALADYTDRDRAGAGVGQDIHDAALPELAATHAVVADLLHAYDWRARLAAGGPGAYLGALAGAVDHLLGLHPGPPEAPCTSGRPCPRCRFMAHAARLVRLFAMCAPAEETLPYRDDVQFFQAVRAQLAKVLTPGREGGDGAELDTAVRQLVSEALTGSGVLDIYAEVGLDRPDLSLLGGEFLDAVRAGDRPHLRVEALRRLLDDRVRALAARNLVAGREFSEMLAESIARYQNRTLTAAQVVAELVDLARHLDGEAARGARLGLGEDELAFYDAIRANGSAVDRLGDAALRRIAHELVAAVRRDARTDWTVKEQVRAKLRTTVKRLLRRHGYPPDAAEAATLLVLAQAETLAALGLSDPGAPAGLPA